MSTTNSTTLVQPRSGTPARAIAAATVGSAATNLAIYVIARIAGADLLVPESPGSDAFERLGPGAVLFSSVIPVLLAAGLALGLRRWVPGRAALVFTIVVLIGLAVSFVPFLASDFSPGTAAALALMHPTVAAMAIAFLRPLTEPLPDDNV